MSCYILNDTNYDLIFNTLLQLDHVQNKSALDNRGQILKAQNYASVNARYKENNTPDAYSFKFAPKATFNRLASIVAALKCLACYQYQSCETEDWKNTEACKIVENITYALIEELPGYADADWGL